MNDPCDLSIREAGDHLRSGKLSAIELTESALRRIDQTEPAIHAYVRVLDEEALAAARQADDDLQAGRDLGPLHGMPIGIKDIFDVEGLATGCGSQTRDGVAAAATDAEVVAKLRAAGAIILGKTVTQEFAAGVVSPPTRNPWDPDRIPGGSSGGSAAAVAAGSCLGALGSDTGGSIRIPAAVTGAVGLKPTFGTVSKRGVFPLSWSLDTVGPLARTVEDTALLLNAIGGAALGDAKAELGLDLRGVRLGVARPHFFDRVQSAVASAVEAALGLFAELGAKVIETPWDAAGSARAAGFVINRVETLGVHGRVLRAALDRYGPELQMRLDATRLFPASHYIDALRARTIVRDSAARLFAAHALDALIVPTLPATAVPAADLFVTHDDGQREPVAVAYTRLTMPFNTTGQPALSVPCGFDADGLPIGLQIVARPFAEARLCRIGHAYERAAGWNEHRPPLIGGKAGAQ